MKTGIFLTISGMVLAAGLAFADMKSTRPDHIPTVPAAGDGENAAVTERKYNASMLAEPRYKKEILDYAKKVFLAHLGFAGAPEPPEILVKVQRACFVTFFSGNRVIACFGNFFPRTGNAADEISENVRMALVADPRARHIDRKTALAADLQITFPAEPCAVSSYAQINPLREGLLVENEHSGVAIVPGEAKTSSWAFREAMRRLGEKDRSKVRIFKFQAFALSSRK